MKHSSHFRLSGVVKKLNEFFGNVLVRGIAKSHVEKWVIKKTRNWRRQISAKLRHYKKNNIFIDSVIDFFINERIHPAVVGQYRFRENKP